MSPAGGDGSNERGPQVYDRKMSRERSGCTRPLSTPGVRAGLVQRLCGPLGPTTPQTLQPLSDSLMDSWEGVRGMAWTLHRCSLDK